MTEDETSLRAAIDSQQGATRYRISYADPLVIEWQPAFRAHWEPHSTYRTWRQAWHAYVKLIRTPPAADSGREAQR
jgi:hypothetical protein